MEPLARFVAFATAGAFQTTQDLVGRIVADVAGADVNVVAEETLALVAVATARAAEVGLRANPAAAQAASAALLALPAMYRDYFVGGALLAGEDGAHAFVDAAEHDRARLERKLSFYTVHLPAGQFPGERALEEKLPLWMGRVSGPGLPEMPAERLGRLGLLTDLLTHLKVVLAFARKMGG